MAHARRYFVEASGNDKQRAEYVIAQLQKLYHFLKELRLSNASKQEIHAQMQEVALPKLNHLHQ